MAGIRSYLTVSPLQATHLWMLNDTSQDPGSNGLNPTDPVVLTHASTVFDVNKVCGGVDNALKAGYLSASQIQSATVGNQDDINTAITELGLPYAYTAKSVCIWFRTVYNDVPTCVWEEGAKVNNFAIIVGLGGAITFQAADAGTPFLIVKSKQAAKVNRNYFVVGVWVYNAPDVGNKNKAILYVNGVLQEQINISVAAPFPYHSGTTSIGNTDDALKSYNESTMYLWARTKFTNMLGLFNSTQITEAQAREIFERTVLPEVVIPADTVANQQAALDALSGTIYQDVNCAIRIMQATDATNYQLILDNITFVENPALRDIAVQFAGTGNLTLLNANGSNAVEVSTPLEVDTTQNTYITCGGTISIIDNVKRLTTVTDLNGGSYTRIVFSVAGTFNFTNVTASSVENVSGGSVIINALGATSITTNLGPNITIQNSKSFSFNVSPAITGYEWRIYTVNALGSLAGAVEVAGEESATASSQTYTYNYTADQPIALQIIANNQDYVESVTYYTLTSIDQNVSINLQRDINN